MDLITNLTLGFGVAVTPINLLYCFIGVLLGTLIGVLPGVGPVATIAIALLWLMFSVAVRAQAPAASAKPDRAQLEAQFKVAETERTGAKEKTKERAEAAAKAMQIASNIDPFATEPAQGSDWITFPPHQGTIGRALDVAGMVASPNPDTSKPVGVWMDTPYVHQRQPLDW